MHRGKMSLWLSVSPMRSRPPCGCWPRIRGSERRRITRTPSSPGSVSSSCESHSTGISFSTAFAATSSTSCESLTVGATCHDACSIRRGRSNPRLNLRHRETIVRESLPAFTRRRTDSVHSRLLRCRKWTMRSGRGWVFRFGHQSLFTNHQSRFPPTPHHEAQVAGRCHGHPSGCLPFRQAQGRSLPRGGRRCRSAPFPAQKRRCQVLNLVTRVKACARSF